jgi:hypothetical protein
MKDYALWVLLASEPGEYEEDLNDFLDDTQDQYELETGHSIYN